MTDSRGFRFSTNVFGLTSRAEFVGFAQRVEALGYDTLFAADHLASYAPFQMVAAAAQATSRSRLGTLVLNVPFRNPALLAREIATADVLTDGLLEVGLGSGHMKWEFDAAGIPWEGFGARAERLERAIEEIGRIFTQGSDSAAASDASVTTTTPQANSRCLPNRSAAQAAGRNKTVKASTNATATHVSWPSVPPRSAWIDGSKMTDPAKSSTTTNEASTSTATSAASRASSLAGGPSPGG